MRLSLAKYFMKKGFAVFVLSLLLLSCKKESPKVDDKEDEFDTYGYEIDCEDCNISYVNEVKEIKTLYNNKGKITIDFNLSIFHELEVVIKVNVVSAKQVKAAIIKNGVSIKEYQSSNSFTLNYTAGSSPIPSNPTKPSNPNPPSQSTTCGAKNKTGGYCQRKVSGGGRCWQHK